mmetsp:Transcript_1080/g.3153  ORF Transcript_1080/g.3153 Transcript_1080/m.3153 type:complete len:290 (+) Transcript_1080:1102-1971(+)
MIHRCRVHTTHSATFHVVRLEVTLMDPSIGAVLDATDDGHGLVVGTAIHGIRIRVQHAGPESGAAKLRCHCHVQLGESCAASFFHVVEIHVCQRRQNAIWIQEGSCVSWSCMIGRCVCFVQMCVTRSTPKTELGAVVNATTTFIHSSLVLTESQDAHTRGTLDLIVNVVGVRVVELILFVLQQLQVLAVDFRNAGDVFDALHDALRDRIFVAFVQAPGVGGRASRVGLAGVGAVRELLTNIGATLVPELGTKVDENLRLDGVDDIFEHEQPWALRWTRDDDRLELLKLG